MVGLRPRLWALSGHGLWLGSEVILTQCHLLWKKTQSGSMHCTNSPPHTPTAQATKSHIWLS